MKEINYQEVARKILTLNELGKIYIPNRVSLKEANEISKDFYKDFFKNRRNNEIEQKENHMIIKRNTIMKEYNGRCKNGTNESLLILPNKNDVKLIISMTHEKAHTYQDNDQINEIIPSFFEILNAILLDKENPGLLHDDLDYKIKEAKKAASCYINFSSKFNDDKLKNFTDYMLQFLQAISLLDLYLDDKNEITNLLDDILFNKINYKDSLDRLFTYQDFDIETKIKNLRKA